MVGLVDCNNFFVSCERVFNPALEGVPVVVLSGNDGCVIARSNEAKAMGIAMGEPFFKIRSLYKDGTLKVCSSNIRLYGDMSKRVMGVSSQSVENAIAATGSILPTSPARIGPASITPSKNSR